MSENPKIKIHVLHCGSISVSPEVPYGGRAGLSSLASELFTPAKKRLTLPVSAYLIEHPKGLLLVDTGWSRDISPDGVYDANAVSKVLPAQLAAFYRPWVAPGQTVYEQLAAIGIAPGDIDCILLSHLDADHTDGLKQLTGAKRILTSEEERWWTVRTVYSVRQPQKMWANYPVETFWYKGTPIGPSRWSYDLFNDGSAVLVNVPGHTDGMFALMIKNSGKFVLLTSDAAFSRRNWEELLVPGFGFNPVSQKKSLSWIREMSLSPNCAAVIANHDPDVKPQVIEI